LWAKIVEGKAGRYTKDRLRCCPFVPLGLRWSAQERAGNSATLGRDGAAPASRWELFLLSRREPQASRSGAA